MFTVVVRVKVWLYTAFWSATYTLVVCETVARSPRTSANPSKPFSSAGYLVVPTYPVVTAGDWDHPFGAPFRLSNPLANPLLTIANGLQTECKHAMHSSHPHSGFLYVVVVVAVVVMVVAVLDVPVTVAVVLVPLHSGLMVVVVPVAVVDVLV